MACPPPWAAGAVRPGRRAHGWADRAYGTEIEQAAPGRRRRAVGVAAGSGSTDVAAPSTRGKHGAPEDGRPPRPTAQLAARAGDRREVGDAGPGSTGRGDAPRTNAIPSRVTEGWRPGAATPPIWKDVATILGHAAEARGGTLRSWPWRRDRSPGRYFDRPARAGSSALPGRPGCQRRRARRGRAGDGRRTGRLLFVANDRRLARPASRPVGMRGRRARWPRSRELAAHARNGGARVVGAGSGAAPASYRRRDGRSAG